MKVKIKGKVYSVEFVTIAKKPKYGKEKNSRILVRTDCLISNGLKVLLSRGSATQNYRDELDWHDGRKHSLARALKPIFEKESRTLFWNRYKEENFIKCK